MGNKLTVWMSNQTRSEIEPSLKERLRRDYGYEDAEYIDTPDGFQFLYDDETGGTIQISFIGDEPNLGVSISGNFSWEVIALHEIVSSFLDEAS